MPVLDFVKASWDHLPPLPKKPKLPPGLLNLRARKIWLDHFRPTFTYGDERDKIQAKQLRAEKRQLERDEAWARRAKRRQQKITERQARLDKKKAATAAKAGAKSKTGTKAGFKQLADPKKKPKAAPSSKPPTTQPQAVKGWAALQVNTTAPGAKRPPVARSPSLPTQRVTHATPQKGRIPYVRSQTIGHGHHAKPGMPSSQQAHRSQRPVRAATQPAPVRRPTTAPPPAAATVPRVVRSNSQPVQSKKRTA